MEGGRLVVAEIDSTLLDEDVLIDDNAVFVKETVQPRRFRHRFRQRNSVHVVVDAAVAKLVEGRLGLPVKVGLEAAKIDEDGLEIIVEVAKVLGLLLTLPPVVVACPGEMGSVGPDCSAVLEEEVVPVNETVQPFRFKQRLTHINSVQVVVGTDADELVLAEVGTTVTGGLVMTELDDNVPDGDGVLVIDRTQLVPRPEQTLAHEGSVHVVVATPEELDVVLPGNPVTVGELADNADPEDGNDDLLVTSVVREALLVKDTVHPKPRLRQTLTHKKSVQVAVVAALVIARLDVADKVDEDVVNPELEVTVLD
ncbi:MAG: hypothetical protein Q9168_004817 [Polycauliona sp. 1 TL-2023]